MARPEKFKPEFVGIAKKACILGATDADLAEMFNVSIRTINQWKSVKPEFAEVLRVGKAEADARVERSLYERANGYSHPEDKIFQYEGEPVIVPTTKQYPPDTTAAIFWLKNRQPEQWRDKQSHEITGANGGPVKTVNTQMTAKEAAELYSEMVRDG